MLFLHWFYKGCPRKTLQRQCKINIFRGQPTRHGFAKKQEQLNCPYNSPSYTIESLISRSPIRTHERNETISRLRFHKGLIPPTSNIIHT